MKKLLGIGLTVGLLGVGCGPADPQLDSSTQPLTRATSKYSSQDLFRGVFFGRGPVAARLPQMWAKGNPGAPKPPAPPTNTELAKALDVETEALGKAGLSAENQKGLHQLAQVIAKDSLSADQLSRQESVDLASVAKDPVTDDQVARVLEAIAKTDPTFLARFAKGIQSGDPLAVSQVIEEGGVQLINASPMYQSYSGAGAASGGFGNGLGERLIYEGVFVIKYQSASMDTALVTHLDFVVDLNIVVNWFTVLNVMSVINPVGLGTYDTARHEAWMKIIAADLAG